jgi:3'-phosphoadenosine 5'-phosphosulfate sulfotransferase (PAPS reductase)/FAD synthetase
MGKEELIMKVIHIISMSGGKDSLATRLIAIEKEIPHIAIFADTGNESQITYDYIEYLKEKTGPIVTVKADFKKAFKHKRKIIDTKWRKEGVNKKKRKKARKILKKPTRTPFLDLALYKDRFPSSKRKFCSYLLKIEPINDYISTLKYDRLWSWQGVRADESPRRRVMPQIEKIDKNFLIVRPILGWSAEQVFRIAKRHGIKPNPLYKKGFSRVGCFPCIQSRKEEVRLIAKLYPKEINRLREWEKMVGSVSKRNSATFFGPKKVLKKDICTIDDIVKWSKTIYRGNKKLKKIKRKKCSSVYGLCE